MAITKKLYQYQQNPPKIFKLVSHNILTLKQVK